eukprot:TRINITY_DN17453_c0_g1_i2.p1 TRINITY_DN17453_c0_g1~~TRINITY_DN17453_c0_g1_i2.p1  ORF type:complete len:208 (-),score=38.10 TRINITY_DN17453_c0_g1_i2:201-824(-)
MNKMSSTHHLVASAACAELPSDEAYEDSAGCDFSSSDAEASMSGASCTAWGSTTGSTTTTGTTGSQSLHELKPEVPAMRLAKAEKSKGFRAKGKRVASANKCDVSSLRTELRSQGKQIMQALIKLKPSEVTPKTAPSPETLDMSVPYKVTPSFQRPPGLEDVRANRGHVAFGHGNFVSDCTSFGAWVMTGANIQMEEPERPEQWISL